MAKRGRLIQRRQADIRRIAAAGDQLDLLDRRPLQLEGFRFKARSVEIVGRPSLENFQAALELAESFGRAAPFWIGALVAYGDSRKDWKDKLDQAVSITKYDRHTLHNHGAVYRALSDEAREVAPSFTHAAAVVTLGKQDQIDVLEKARTEGLTVREVVNVVRSMKRPRVIEGQALLEGKYRVILADPPWTYSDSSPSTTLGHGAQDTHYRGMTMDDIAKLPVEAHSLPNAVLFLWVTATMLFENPGPRDIIEAWGFKPKTGIVWDKVLGMPGHYGFHVRHEHLIIATRGSCLPDVGDPQDDSVQVIRRGDEHSGKPEDVRRIIERHWTSGPYLEMFARSRPPAPWKFLGNDARLWQTDEASA